MHRLSILILFLFCLRTGFAQKTAGFDHDTSYYTSYSDMMLGRFYFSKKYTTFNFGDQNKVREFTYRPNTTLNMGIGATYKSLTLNLAYGFNFLNRNKNEGKTKYLDLQSHFYSRKWAVDWYGQFYRGYFLTPKGLVAPPGETYYKRPDLKVRLVGISAYHIYNNDRFSFRAATLQNEWQKKSAGTILLGAEVYYGSVQADSALVPSLLATNYQQRNVNKIHAFNIGPGIGYAYTFVIERHFFAGGGLTLNANLGWAKEYENNVAAQQDKISITPNFSYRATIGYNSATWSGSATWVGNRINFKGDISPAPYVISAGNVRLTVSKRFHPGKKLKKKLKPLDQLMGQ